MHVFFVLFTLLGCKEAPPNAPSELEDLSEFIYSRFTDENPEELRAGLENLYEWLYTDTNLGKTVEGYQIENLKQETVDSLDDKQREIGENLAGAAIAYRHNHPFEPIIQATLIKHWPTISGENYALYDRTYAEDPSCLLDRSCMENSYDSHSISTWVGGLFTVEVKYKGEIRWVETEHGWMLIQRTWMNGEGVITPDTLDIELKQQYYLAVNMVARCNGTLRLVSNWIDTEYGVLPVSEDWAKAELVDSMNNQEIAIENWASDRSSNAD